MICIDNSEWMRNGDYSPNRFQAQVEAVNLICGAKTQFNPENTVVVLTMAGMGVRVLVTPTCDLGKILACMHGLEIGGEMNLAASIQVAQLVLKHRQNKKQQRRIIVFAGSPVKYDNKVLEFMGKKLKKNSITLDIVNFGEQDEEKCEKIEDLLAAVNNSDSSHNVHVPPGPSALSDVLISTPIFTGDGEGGSGFVAAGGVTVGLNLVWIQTWIPNLLLHFKFLWKRRGQDKKLLQRRLQKKLHTRKKKEEQSTSQDAAMTENVNAATSEHEKKTHDLMDDENALLQQALAMSMDGSSSTAAVRDTNMSDASADDHDLQLDSAVDQSNQTDVNKLLADQSFVSSILVSLPGVDPNDPHVKDFLTSMQSQSENKDEDKTSKDKERKRRYNS